MSLYNRSELVDMLPHSGSMSLLDTVVEYSSERIKCTATSHRDPQNPLRINGRLSIYSGVEYAAQAMAVHNYLSRATGEVRDPKQGVVAVASKLRAHCSAIDCLSSAVEINVAVVDETGDSALYGFMISSSSTRLLEGRLLVMLAQ